MLEEVSLVVAVECGPELALQMMCEPKRRVCGRILRVNGEAFLVQHQGRVQIPAIKSIKVKTYLIFR